MAHKFGKAGQMARVEKELRNITLEDKKDVKEAHEYTKKDEVEKEHREH